MSRMVHGMEDPQPHFSGPDGGDLPDLTDVLLQNERVVFVSGGRVTTSWRPRFGRWSVVVTDRRLLCLRENGREPRQQIQVSLANIESAYHGVVPGRIVVQTRKGALRISGMSRSRCAQLLRWLLSMARPEGQQRRQIRSHEPPPLLIAQEAEDPLLARIEFLEVELDRLVRQVRFLEELLNTHQQTRSHIAGGG